MDKIIEKQVIVLLLIVVVHMASARVKRCYVCRSRGPLGDCKDNFEFNLTTIESSAVEAQPCASGWCGKSIESKDEGPLLVATERMCLQRPPSDNKERCADTFYGTKKRTIFMCFCKGDLCNKSYQFELNHVLLTFIIMLSYFMV